MYEAEQVENQDSVNTTVSAFFLHGARMGPFSKCLKFSHWTYISLDTFKNFECPLNSDSSCLSRALRLNSNARLYSEPVKNVYDPYLCLVSHVAIKLQEQERTDSD